MLEVKSSMEDVTHNRLVGTRPGSGLRPRKKMGGQGSAPLFHLKTISFL